jgi:hypothetical protein
MTTDELVTQVLQGILVLVGNYRGSHAEAAGYVDKKSGQAIRSVRAIHLVECVWYDRVDRVVLMQYFGGGATLEQAAATFRYERGRKYVFYLESFKRERGQLTGRLAGWDPEPLEITEEAGRSPEGEPPPF